METLRNSRYFVLALLVFIGLLLLLMGTSALRTVADVAREQTAAAAGSGTPDETAAVVSQTAIALLASPTATLRLPTETLTPTPPLATPTSGLPSYPGPGVNPPTPAVSPTSAAGGYPAPVTTPAATNPAYPGPGATQPAGAASPSAPPQGGATATQTATPPVGPSATWTVQPTASQQLFLPCNLGEFVYHVNYPPDTPVYPHESFTKTWQVRNGGTCTWNTSYDLVFDRGDQMDAKRRIALNSTVPPNSFANLSIDFQAPLEPGVAKGFWLLRSNEGEVFGMGVSRDQPLEVRVQVREPNPEAAYDMANGACTASWLGRTGLLPCQGDPNAVGGSIVLLEAPVLEGDRLEDQTTLWTRPGTLSGATITGYYPGYVVQPGDHFLADVGCLAGNELCDIVFTVSYRGTDDREQILGSFEEDYDGNITRIDIDLTDLAGQEIGMVLRTRAFSQQTQGNGFWLAPGIYNLP